MIARIIEVRLSRGMRLSVKHEFELLVTDLPKEDPWRAKLVALEPLSGYATSVRCLSPTGNRKTGPSDNEVLAWVDRIAKLASEVRALLAVESSAETT